jgi:hypothetical protein
MAMGDPVSIEAQRRRLIASMMAGMEWSRPGYGLRGLVGEDAWHRAGAEPADSEFPCGWAERDAAV